MKIGIDARIDKHGVGTYVSELLYHLSEIDSKNQYTIICSSQEKFESYKITNNNFKPTVVNVPPFSLKEQIYLPYWIRKENIDLFHATSYVVPIICRCPLLVTIHDLVCKTNPNFYPSFKGLKYYIARSYYDFMNWYAIKYSKHIITVSGFAKQTILQYFPNEMTDKITVIYNGVGHQFQPTSPGNIKKIKVKYQIRGKYLLFVGTFNKIKNLANVIRAFSELTSLRNQGYQLIIVAKKDLRYPAPFRLIERLNLKNDVIFTGYIPKEDLSALYSGTEVLVVPSFHESFGLPVLEAFACGVPVITSNTSALPEVAGDAAILVNPHNIEELKEAVLKIVSDANRRSSLITKGFSQASKFSWTIAARKVLDVYKLLAQKRAINPGLMT